MQWQAEMRVFAEQMLRWKNRITVTEAVDEFEANHPEAVKQAAEMLLRAGLRSKMRRFLKDMADATEEDMLPGIEVQTCLPVCQEAGETIYVYTMEADLTDLERVLVQKMANIEHATKREQLFREMLDTLRPYMEGTDRTVREAIRLMKLDLQKAS